MDESEARSERLDQAVIRQVPSLSRTAAVVLIEAGKATVNGSAVRKPGYKLKAGDITHVDFDPAEAPKPPAIELPIIYEDKSCVVLNKPVGLLTHSKGAFNPEATVATWLAARTKGVSGERAGIVHRLDRATSGVMICAKTPEALSWLQKQFAERKTKKTYLAVVEGIPSPVKAVIDMPIERNPKKPQTFRVGINGKPSVTAYNVVKAGKSVALVELSPTTGRTHQLRVHLRHVGHPIVGDMLYGGPVAERLFLHAEKLEITLPSKTRKIFEAPVPADFAEYVKHG